MNDLSDQHQTVRKNPLLVYDGDCGFCVYSVRYWQQLTGDAVEYKPYQDVAANYPEISVDQFKRAVQYITPDRQIASGAHASFLTMSHGSGSALWLTLYRKLPGFAYGSEKAYHLISTHRPFFHALSIFFWGRHPVPPTYDLLISVFLRLFGMIFLVAFYSFATQSLGLIGRDGIIPIASFLSAVHSQIGAWGYWYLPCSFWFNASDFAIQLVSWSGVLCSVLLIFNIFPRLCLLALYVLYLTVIYGGQVFMTFQWDMLLLEISILAIILIRYRVLGIWLLRWLTFRFIFAAGMVKIMSGDPSWWDYTALDYHFLTQPLPTPLAWYAFYFPHAVLKFATIASLLIELPIPFLIFAPRRLRFFAAFSILAMQVGIMLTGNYNFFNISTILILITLFDDAAIKVLIPSRVAAWLSQRPLKKPALRITKWLVAVFVVISVLLSFIQFNLRFIGKAPEMSSKINNMFAPLQMVNTYGPFAVMTKKRFEIIIEGSNDGVNWREYNFKYKPGNVYRKPRWNIPFQPRLDWQMWFAALGNAENNPWVGRFLQKLLENSPDVLALMDGNPFPDYPPVFVRALFFDYTYTTRAEYDQTKAWWNRELVGVYFPQASLN